MADWSTYLAYHLVDSQSAVLPTQFTAENFAFYGKYLTGAKEQKPRWKRCVRATDGDLGEALGKAYVDLTFGREGKQRTLDMVNHIEAAMAQDLNTLTWMTPADEEKSARKAARRHQQNRLSRQVARLLRAENRARRCAGKFAARQRIRSQPPAAEDRQAGRPPRMGHDAAHRQRLLRSADEQHQFPGRHSAAAVLRQAGGRRHQLRRHRRRDRPRTDARLRR